MNATSWWVWGPHPTQHLAYKVLMQTWWEGGAGGESLQLPHLRGHRNRRVFICNLAEKCSCPSEGKREENSF